MHVLERYAYTCLDILFPPQCVSCRVRLAREVSGALPVICEACFSSIEIYNGFSCPACGKRLYEPHLSCHRDACFIVASAAPFSSSALQALIHALKYQSCRAAVLPLATLLQTYAVKTRLFDILPETLKIIPIPLHPRRERRRGFNQAELIARSLLASLPDPRPELETGNLIRIRNTPSQVERKTYEGRLQNVTGAFRLLSPERVSGKTIILLDDVYTSGATMTEAARVLKEAGARRIVALTVAKA